MEYFHVYTKGLNKNLLFSCDEDFIYGMNLIPKCLRGTDIRLLAFCLMDNHLHFILGAPRDACNRFIVNYKRNLGAFLAGSGRKIGEAVEASVSRVSYNVGKYRMTTGIEIRFLRGNDNLTSLLGLDLIAGPFEFFSFVSLNVAIMF